MLHGGAQAGGPLRARRHNLRALFEGRGGGFGPPDQSIVAVVSRIKPRPVCGARPGGRPGVPPMNDAAIAPPTARVWKFWGSLLWGVAIFLVMSAAQIATAIVILKWRSPAFSFSDLARLSSDGVAVALTVIATAPAALAVVWLAVCLTRGNFADYLALRPFAPGDLLLGLGFLVICALGVDLIARLAGHVIVPRFVFDTLRSASAAHALPLF